MVVGGWPVGLGPTCDVSKKIFLQEKLVTKQTHPNKPTQQQQLWEQNRFVLVSPNRDGDWLTPGASALVSGGRGGGHTPSDEDQWNFYNNCEFVTEPSNRENVCGSYCSGFRSTNEALKLRLIEWKNSFGSGGKWEQDLQKTVNLRRELKTWTHATPQRRTAPANVCVLTLLLQSLLGRPPVGWALFRAGRGKI